MKIPYLMDVHTDLQSMQSQGVVTYILPVEVCDWIKNFDRWKLSLISWLLHSKALDFLIAPFQGSWFLDCSIPRLLIAWLLHSKALDCLILWESKGQKCSHASLVSECVDRLILFTQSLAWSLDRLIKRTLIAFWSMLQMLLQMTHRWLALDR